MKFCEKVEGKYFLSAPVRHLELKELVLLTLTSLASGERNVVVDNEEVKWSVGRVDSEVNCPPLFRFTKGAKPSEVVSSVWGDIISQYRLADNYQADGLARLQKCLKGLEEDSSPYGLKAIIAGNAQARAPDLALYSVVTDLLEKVLVTAIYKK